MEGYLRTGLIQKPHGVAGAVKLLPLTDDARRFEGMGEAYLEQGDVHTPVLVERAQVAAGSVQVKLAGCDTREAAEALRGAYLCVDRAHAAPLPPGRYFIADLVGCAVEDSAGTCLGTLADVLQHGAADVYVIRGSRNLLVPALNKLLVLVDVAARRIVLDATVLQEVGLYEG